MTNLPDVAWEVEAGAIIQELIDNPSLFGAPEVLYEILTQLEDRIPSELCGKIIRYRAACLDKAQEFFSG